MWFKGLGVAAELLSIFGLISSVFVLDSRVALAGSIADDIQVNAPFSCDKRVEAWSTVDLSWCTTSQASVIKDSCFAVVHSAPGLAGKQCGWQGCGMLSIIGEAASVSGSNFVEYGMSNAIPAGASYQTLPSGKVLPKRPFMRHYIKLGDALNARRACPSNPQNLPADVLDAICKADAGVLNLNPYWMCVSSF